MNKLIATTLIAGAAMLAGCGGNDGSPTSEEDRQLNEAANMLDDNLIDASPDSLVADENAALGNGEVPAETGELPAATDPGTNAADAP